MRSPDPSPLAPPPQDLPITPNDRDDAWFASSAPPPPPHPGTGASFQTPQTWPPRHLGRYRLIERIGRGASGEVFRAEHALLGRPVAIKLLRPRLTQDSRSVGRFLAEARAVNRIRHENILEVSDFVREPNGAIWSVMELLEGKELAALLRQQHLSIGRCLGIARQICEALAAVHAAGIVHRDVKPENVFVVDRAGRDLVKLLDFGIALLPDGDISERLAPRGEVFGTPPYMAPEQATAGHTDHRCDLYAIGALLFELISGRSIFSANSLSKLLSKVVSEEPPPLSQHARVPECIRDDLDCLIACCLAKQPHHRPKSARELAAALRALEHRVAGTELAPQQALAPARASVENGDHRERVELPDTTLSVAVRTRRPVARWLATAAVLTLAAWGTLRPAWMAELTGLDLPAVRDAMRSAAALVPATTDPADEPPDPTAP